MPRIVSTNDSKWSDVGTVMLGVFNLNTLLFILLAADSALLGPNLTLIAEEFEFDREKKDSLLGGRMKLVFFFSGIPFAAAAGLISDMPSCANLRKHIVGVSVLVAHVACIRVWYLPHGPDAYDGLLKLQAVTGASIGAASAAGMAMMAENVPSHVIGFAVAIGGVVYSLGAATGQYVAGHKGPREGWRYPFLFFGVLGIAVALLVVVVRCCPCARDFREADVSEDGSESEASFDASDSDDGGGGAVEKGHANHSNQGRNGGFKRSNEADVGSDDDGDDGGGGDDGDDDGGGEPLRLFSQRERSHGKEGCGGGDRSTHSKGGGGGASFRTLHGRLPTAAEAAAAEENRARKSPYRLPAGGPSGRCCKFLWCTPSVPLLCAVILLVCVPHGVLDTYWTDFLTLFFYLERSGGTSRGGHGQARFEAKWKKAAGLATNVSVAVNVGVAVGQVVGGLLAVHFSCASLSRQVRTQERGRRQFAAVGVLRSREERTTMSVSGDNSEKSVRFQSLSSEDEEAVQENENENENEEVVGNRAQRINLSLSSPRQRAENHNRSQAYSKIHEGDDDDDGSGGDGGGDSAHTRGPQRHERFESSRHMYAFMILVYLLAPVPFVYVMVFAPSSKGHYVSEYLLMDFLGGILRGLNEPLVKAILLALSPPDMLGAGAAVLTVTTEIGRGLGPGLVSSYVRAQGRHEAFALAFLFWVVAAVLLLGLCCCYDRDARHAVERDQRYRRRLEGTGSLASLEDAASGGGGGGEKRGTNKKRGKNKNGGGGGNGVQTPQGTSLDRQPSDQQRPRGQSDDDHGGGDGSGGSGSDDMGEVHIRASINHKRRIAEHQKQPVSELAPLSPTKAALIPTKTRTRRVGGGYEYQVKNPQTGKWVASDHYAQLHGLDESRWLPSSEWVGVEQVTELTGLTDDQTPGYATLRALT
eukprot:CAMPEP_0171865562 /NCGR_PEP_ID=MMETSP0992-20121227/29631_1 /TAXON_ID=483369 /ORGANISM="non described non described, Strain CCMP2098" /LENGTH=926 /DNA_ID=CAMNT_0012488557 /DNA_START=84 /DNA_END=2863 /DNA_ORIENTATION=-